MRGTTDAHSTKNELSAQLKDTKEDKEYKSLRQRFRELESKVSKLNDGAEKQHVTLFSYISIELTECNFRYLMIVRICQESGAEKNQ